MAELIQCDEVEALVQGSIVELSARGEDARRQQVAPRASQNREHRTSRAWYWWKMSAARVAWSCYCRALSSLGGVGQRVSSSASLREVADDAEHLQDSTFTLMDPRAAVVISTLWVWVMMQCRNGEEEVKMQGGGVSRPTQRAGSASAECRGEAVSVARQNGGELS